MSTAPQRVPVRRAYRFELVKLLSQWRTRLLIAACWLGPALFVAVVSRQASLPVDTLFGRSMHATGWAGSLVVLGFSGSWALPLVTSLVAGDVFAAEDRLGTWRHLLIAVRSPWVVFVSKALASLTVILVLVAGLAVSSAAAGIAVAGNRPLIGLDGSSLDAGGLVALAWVCVLAPTLALAAVGLLGSVALGKSPMGLLLPAVVALAMQLALMLPLPAAVRLALPGYAFISWNGLFTRPFQTRSLVIGIVVSLVWALAASSLAVVLFRRRDFGQAVPGTSLVIGAGALVGLLVVTVAVLAPVASGSGITQAKVQRALATSFAALYRLQTGELNRPDVTQRQLRSAAACTKGGDQVAAEGPGNDWRCVVSWRLPGVDAAGQAVYQLDVNPLGRFTADGDGPKEVNGYFLVRTPAGDEPNPLWQFDGLVDLLSSSGKG